MAGRNHRNTPNSILTDPKNLDIVAAQTLKPSASLEEIGQAVGLAPSNVCRRLKRIREALLTTDEVAISCGQMRALVPLCVAVYADAIAHGDVKAARDVLITNRVLVERHQHEFDPTNIAQVRDLLNKVPDAVLHAIAGDDTSASAQGEDVTSSS